MPQVQICKRGHRWNAATDRRPDRADRWKLCPVCGGSVELFSLQPTPRPAGGAGAAAMPPGPAADAACSRTMFMRHLTSVRRLVTRRGLTRPKRIRLQLEALDIRALPSTFSVFNLSDDGAGSLRAAIAAAEANPGADMIDFASGVEGTIPLTTGELNIHGDLTIAGPGADRLTISGSDTSRVFNVVGGPDESTRITVSIADLTISHGRAGLGGGVQNQLFSDLTLSRVTLLENQSIDSLNTFIGGGAVANSGNWARLTVDHSLLSNNTSASYGGAIYNNLGTTTLADSTLRDNSAVLNGGAIANLSFVSGEVPDEDVDPGSLTVTRCTLLGNSAEVGGGIMNYGGTVLLSFSTLSGNSAAFGGGGICDLSGTETISDSTLSGNSALSFGGGIYNLSGTLTLSNTTLSGNTAHFLGGGIYSYDGFSGNDATLNLSHCTLSGNSAGAGGGLATQSEGTATLTDCTVSGNSAAGEELGFFSGAGGGIFNDGHAVTLFNTTLSDNSATGSGAGIYNWGRLTVAGSTLSDNSAGISGGGIYNLGTVTLNNSILSGNSTAENGNGGAVFNVGTLTVISSVLSGNSVGFGQGGGQGGAIFNLGNGTLTLTSSILSGNSAVFGGGILNYSGTVTLADSTLSGNRAGQGGGIYSISTGPIATTTLTNCTLSDNLADNDGGGIFNLEGTLTLANSLVSSNSAGFRGGGIYSNVGGVNTFGTVTLSNCTLSGNSAGTDGAGIYNSSTVPLMLSDCTLSGNSAGLSGGGICSVTPPNGTVTLTNCTLSDNSALFGGGIYLAGGTATLTGSTLLGNSADLNGGGICNLGTLTLSNCVLSGNSAHTGGGIFTSGGTLMVTSSTISGNSAGDGAGIAGFGGTVMLIDSILATNAAGHDAGGIYIGGGTVTLSTSSLSGNSAIFGGGIWNASGLTLIGSTLSDNSASVWGGGIYNSARVTVANSTLSGNSAESEGGGIYNFGSVTVINSTLSRNSAGFRGGGISGAATLIDSTLSANSSLKDGGGIWSFEGPVTLTGCTVSGNSALREGGGIWNGYGSVTLNNTIVANSLAGGQIVNLLGTLLGSHNLIENESPSGLSGTITADPMLGPLQDNGGSTQTHALLPGGPAIDAGGNDLVPVDVTTDQRGPGFLRIAAGAVDIGAFEVQNQAPTVTVPGMQTTFEDWDKAISGLSVGDPDGGSLTVNIAVAHGTLTLGTTTGLTVSGNGSGAVSLSGGVADLNAALATLVYRGGPNFGGDDLLSVIVTDGEFQSSGSVAIHVTSAAEQAAALRTQVNTLYAAGVLKKNQANAILGELDLKGNSGDIGKVQSFLNDVAGLLKDGVLTAAQAEALLRPGNILLQSVTVR